MPNKGNREFKELIEQVYEQKFDNNHFRKKILEDVKTIPSFFYNDVTNQITIELKENETNHYSDLGKFYDDLQHIQNNVTKQLTITINCDEKIYSKIINQYIDIFHFVNKPNTKYYTKKYFKEKILVELQALEDILQYAMHQQLNITVNDRKTTLTNENIKINFDLSKIEEHYYLVLKQDINKFYYVLHTNHYVYIFYDKNIYQCDEAFLKKEYAILMVFLNNYQNRIHISKTNLPNFFSLIYPNIKENMKTEEIDE